MGQKGSKIQITETDKAILQIKRSKDELHKFTRRTDDLILDEKLQLKQLIKNNPKNYKQNVKVRLLLKRIHYQEHLLQQAADQLINLENMVSNIEFKLIEANFIEGLKNGNMILTKLNREFKNIDELMDDVQEQIQYQDEIDNVLSHSVVGVSNFEEELDRELDSLENELNPLPSLPNTDGLPPIKNNMDEVPVEADINEEPQKQKVALTS